MLEGNKILIRRAKADDIEVISQIERTCFPGLTAYSKRHLAYLILKANSSTLVETENSTLHGFIIITYHKRSRIGNVETIDVDPSFQKQGVGLRLLAAAEEDMKEHGMKFSQLEVSEGNHAAIKLYQKAGYTIKQKLADYYQFEHNGSCNAIRMIRVLDAVH
ncbi:TPA: GNAT family N-acetyltransferase [Candidatus Bathyarchaeota archaeon]|nr:GNAT family N-acetyltransferase [Candidatus Bathyarchaeota archaeon]HIJ09049.1 GNAT family N-acetyltransferase [Candidatus Bathyarchaeota archaeon]